MNIYIGATFTIVFCVFLCKVNSFCMIFFLCSNPYIFVAAAIDWILIPSCTSNSSLLLLQGHNFHQVLPFNCPPKILQKLKWCCITKQAATSFRRMLTLLTLGDSHTASSWKTNMLLFKPLRIQFDMNTCFQMFSTLIAWNHLPTWRGWCGWSLTTRDLQLVPTNLNWSYPEAQRGPALEGPFHAQKWGKLSDWKTILGDGPGYVFCLPNMLV